MLILDEPTAGVDIDIRTSVWNYIKEINSKGTTICLTTHYLEEAENLCDRISIINFGRKNRRFKINLLNIISIKTVCFIIEGDFIIPNDLEEFQPKKDGKKLTITYDKKLQFKNIIDILVKKK